VAGAEFQADIQIGANERTSTPQVLRKHMLDFRHDLLIARLQRPAAAAEWIDSWLWFSKAPPQRES